MILRVWAARRANGHGVSPARSRVPRKEDPCAGIARDRPQVRPVDRRSRPRIESNAHRNLGRDRMRLGIEATGLECRLREA